MIQKTKTKISMTTSNYKLDTRYALVDTDIIFHSISDINHITQNTDITFQLFTYNL